MHVRDGAIPDYPIFGLLITEGYGGQGSRNG